ncbi:MAG: hypothetical protein PHI12_07670 [Dehalococcoidales bacterium]|nr:hypothetical protein [Dehalococcoidales bacterium]
MNTDTIKVEYRSIAKVLCTNIPECDYTAAVESTLEAVKNLPEQTKLSMRIAYIFASKVPYDDRLDCFQDFTATLLKSGIDEPKLAYSVIRGDWLDWWKASKIHAHIDLDSKIESDDGDVTSLGDLIVGEIEFVNKYESDDTAVRLWSRIPDDIKPLIIKRMRGQSLTHDRAIREPVQAPIVGKHRKEYKRFLLRGRPITGHSLSNTERSQLARWIAKSGYQLTLS